jgi:hypothetical protein
VVVAVNWLTTISTATRDIDFNEFAEPFRRVRLGDIVPNWVHVATGFAVAPSQRISKETLVAILDLNRGSWELP